MFSELPIEIKTKIRYMQNFWLFFTQAGTVVMTDGEELDSWSVIINGHVEVVDGNGETRELHLGDSFG